MIVEQLVEWTNFWGNRCTQRKPDPVPLSPPQIPHDLTRDRTRSVTVGSQRLTAWATARHTFTRSLFRAETKVNKHDWPKERGIESWLFTEDQIQWNKWWMNLSILLGNSPDGLYRRPWFQVPLISMNLDAWIQAFYRYKCSSKRIYPTCVMFLIRFFMYCI
jgi:hypothetical protein